jgi:cell division transport system permease protein
MRLNRSGYLIREGFRSIGTHGFMSFATVTIIMACLIIMGSVTLLSLNIDRLINSLENQN